MATLTHLHFKKGSNVIDMKAMASDFDGTLYFMLKDEKIRESDIKAIRAYQQEGHLFGVCTGRSLRGVLDFVPEDLFDFYIMVSGALVLNKDLQVIAKTCVSYELMQLLYRKYEEEVRIIIQANDNVYSMKERLPYMGYIQEFAELEGADIYGLSFGCKSEEDAYRIAAEINEAYGDTIRAFANVVNVDIVSKECSKGNAIATLKEALGIEHIAGIGDSHNDIPMLQSVDHAFTFPYAPSQTQDAADDIVDTVADAIDLLIRIMSGNPR